jgi:Sigma-70 region 2
MRLLETTVSDMDDLALVQEIQCGNDDAFALLLDRHVHHVRAFLALKAPVPHLVDELAHETFVFAFHHISQFKPGTSVQAWLRAVAWNLLRAEIQRFSREQANQSRFAAQRICESVLADPEPTAPARLEFLLESFVQRGCFAGTSYQAAHWLCVGQSRGRGRQGPNPLRPTEEIKDVYLYSLDRQFRQHLLAAP